jgi:hypothetical protein
MKEEEYRVRYDKYIDFKKDFGHLFTLAELDDSEIVSIANSVQKFILDERSNTAFLNWFLWK